MSKPNCYECKYRRNVPGSAHSSCVHPETGLDKSNFPMFDGITAILGIGPGANAIKKLNIKANLHGLRNGWFMWPGDFDPTWLLNCDGFEAKDE